MQNYFRGIVIAAFMGFSGCAHSPGKGAATSVVPATTEPLVFAVAADAGRWNANAESTRDSMLKLGVHRLILPGDNLYSPHKTYAEAWGNWQSKGFTFDVVAIGNHFTNYAEEIAFFQTPGEYYAKAYPGMRFLVLNSDNQANAKEQLSWLKGELRSAQEPLLFVVLHHPPYTIATQGHHWTEKKRLQVGLRLLLKTYRAKVTALLVGHDHLAELVQAGDLPLVVSGAAQDIRQDMQIDENEQGTRVRTLYYFDSVPTWVRLSGVDGHPREATIDFVRSSDSAIRCTARLTTGLAPKPQANCPAPPDAP